MEVNNAERGCKKKTIDQLLQFAIVFMVANGNTFQENKKWRNKLCWC